MSPKYRPDIDGLRAIAVLSVVFFHAGLPGFSGGFVGVDVFFVISGFLISSILHREIRAGEFSVLKFYERRARRILPALFTVLFASFIAAYLYLLPDEFDKFSRSNLATLAFGSNFWFWRNSGGYFQNATEYMPLLHTWSLAVEEQYYIFIPLVLVAINRWAAAAFKPILILMLLCAFMLAIWATPKMPSASFFLLPTRFWELLVGGLLALGSFSRSPPRLIRESIATVAIAAILLPVFFYTKSTTFPGLASVPPVLGTTALIYIGCSGSSFVGWLLSLRQVVFLGLISYSLYLWHWPILAFLRIELGTVDLPILYTFSAIIISILFAVLSWRFIEQPFRSKRQVSGSQLLTFSLVGMAILTLVSVPAVLLKGIPSRFDRSKLAELQLVSEPYSLAATCNGTRKISDLCRFGDLAGAKNPSFLLWGDSHAGSILPAMESVANQFDQQGLFASEGGCAPFPGIFQTGKPFRINEKCEVFTREVLSYLISTPSISTVFLGVRWPIYFEGNRLAGEPGSPVHLYDINASVSQVLDANQNSRIVEQVLSDLVEQLTSSGKNVVLLGPIPEIGWDPASMLKRAILLGSVAPADPQIVNVVERQQQAISVLKQIANIPRATYLPITSEICTETCPVRMGQRSYYRDNNHLNEFGSRMLLIPILRPYFAENFD